MYGGVKPDDVLRPWLLAIHMIIAEGGIVTNDPGTGQQVIRWGRQSSIRDRCSPFR